MSQILEPYLILQNRKLLDFMVQNCNVEEFYIVSENRSISHDWQELVSKGLTDNLSNLRSYMIIRLFSSIIFDRYASKHPRPDSKYLGSWEAPGSKISRAAVKFKE